MASRRQLREAERALAHATSASEWQQAAAHHDALTGAAAWRDEDDSAHYDARTLRTAILTLRGLRTRGDGEALAHALTETLYRHQAELAEADLYTVALSGTKKLVDHYLDECETCLRWLASHRHPSVSEAQQRGRFEAAWRVYGRSALMLSGGATLGFHHLGVVKALLDHGLLPDILTGASTGAMIAAGTCTRTDAELADMYANTDAIRLDGLLRVSASRFAKTGAWLDPQQLHEVLRHNVGPMTFAEAHAHSGRELNISVSPTRSRQKPRLLSHLTAPDVLVSRAALASSALPGLFPPIELEMRDRSGTVIPYIDGERWVDGSLHGDLPKLRLSRLHNVNHFIVSQTNPHVLPFVSHRGRSGVVPALSGLVSSTARTQAAHAADLARRATHRAPGAMKLAAQQLHNLVSQDYRGDIDIHPQFHWKLYRKVVSNPTRADLAQFILEGERSVWPMLARIRNETRIGRTFADCARAQEAS